MTSHGPSVSASSEDEYEGESATQGQWQSRDNTDPSTAVGGTAANSSNDSIAPSIPLQKRRRVTRACDECRRKKIKCDGKHPCSHCQIYSYDCTYDQPSNRRRNPAPQYVEALEVKLQRAEAILKSVYPHVDLEDPDLDEQFSLDHPPKPKIENLGRNAARSGTGTLAEQQSSADNDKDAMLESMVQNTGSLDLDDEGYWDFYGGSSGRIFLMKMREQFGNIIGKPEAVTLPAMPPRPRAPPASLSPSSSMASPAAPRIPSTNELPSKECARMLCQNSIDDACAIVRFIHKPTFYANLDRIYDSRYEDLTPEEIRFIPCLYAAIALGTLFASPEETELEAHGLENAIEQGMQWFRAARSMVDSMDCRDLTSLQTLLFMVMFLQSGSKLSTCYSYIGVILRSAIRLGLHRSVSNTFDPVEHEVRKRIFWCVRKMDIYVAAMLGLPQMLNDDDIDQEYPIEVDDEYITVERVLPMPPGKPSLMAAFNNHTRMIAILAKVLKHIYPTKGLRSKSNQSYVVSHAKIRELEQELQKWYEQLPEAFRPGRQDSPRELVRIQHLLRMAYAYIEMFLYRPFLHYVSRDVQAKNVDERSSACAAACVSVARNIIHLSADMKKKGLLMGSYWFYMYTTFFAVISLVFFVLENPNSSQSIEILRDAHEGRDTLAGLAKRSLAARKCTSTLMDLFDQLPKRLKSTARTTTNPPSKKRQAPPALRIDERQRQRTAPAAPQRNIPRESQSASLIPDNWQQSFDMSAPPPRHQQSYDSYHQSPQEQMSPTGRQHPTVAPGSGPSQSPFPYPQTAPGIGVPDMSAVMFPSEDPFVYPQQPITTLESQREIKQEGRESLFSSPNDHRSGNAPYGGPMLVQPQPYSMPQPTSEYSLHEMPMTSADPQNALAMSGQGWPAEAGPRRGDEVPLDQLFGEDWGGWMNPSYRQ